MFKYWSFWNFNWYLCAEAGLLNFNGPLRTSIINTSIIGAFMTYVYPKKLTIQYKNKKYRIPYHFIVFGDLILHQLPMIRMIMSTPKQKICGLYSTIPVLGWFYFNYRNKINLNKIYGIKMSYLTLGSIAITLSYGLFSHNKNLSIYKLK